MSKDTLEHDTETYLGDLYRARDLGDRFQILLEKYVGEDGETGLLARHMNALENGQISLGCNTLVLLVGHSVEPILQSIWAHKPDRLMLILSPRYGRKQRKPGEYWEGEEFYENLETLLGNLPQEIRSKWWKKRDSDGISKLTPVYLERTTPSAVFQKLLQHVRDCKDVVIDITGAKKSMASGAFLYAAYAQASIAYVDYDDEAYSAHFRAPYGYRCQIRHFPSPYDDFALRDWERVQQLYLHYRFREAQRLLLGDENNGKGIIAAMKGHRPSQEQAYFAPEQVEATRTLAKALQFYELWNTGDFQGAWKQAQELEKCGINLRPLPTAIEEFEKDWPTPKGNADKRKEEQEPISVQTIAKNLIEMHADLTQDYEDEEKRKQADPQKSLYCQVSRLVIYAKDELARIERLIRYNEDHRSALLRAAGLNEVLLKARFINLVVSEKRPGEFKNAVAPRPIKRIWRILISEIEELQIDDCELKMETLLTLRNKTVHTYLPIPKSLAVAALRIVERNLDEYEQVWAKRVQETITVEALSWKEICEQCGVDQFLPPNLLD